jgi:hypothetical protein
MSSFYLPRFSIVLVALAVGALVACGDDPDSQPPKNGDVEPDGAAGASGGGGQCSGPGCSEAGDAGGQAGDDACVPTTCSAEGKNCGSIADGCGQELDCGVCETGQECGSVIANVCGCPPGNDALASAPRTARRARSSGFAGTEAAYSELHSVVCTTVADCVQACLDRGGGQPMCDTSQCLDNAGGGSDCLPAPIWTNLQNIQFEGTSVADAAQLTVVNTTYHDVLLTDQFKLEVPEAAEVQGITVEVRKAGSDSVVDDSVRIIKGGVIGAAERASSQVWSADLTWVSYGGPADLWGEQWSAADLNSDDFGVALSVLYTRTVGNTRAYVDQVRVTVHYAIACN